MKVSSSLRYLATVNGIAGQSVEELRVAFAKTRVSSKFADQWTTRLAEALSMDKLSKDELAEIAETTFMKPSREFLIANAEFQLCSAEIDFQNESTVHRSEKRVKDAAAKMRAAEKTLKQLDPSNPRFNQGEPALPF